MKPLASPIWNASGGVTALCALPVAILRNRGEKVAVVCWDNAPCESWFGKLKSEWIYPNGV